MKYAVEMGSSSMIYTPSFIKIGSGIQKLTVGKKDRLINLIKLNCLKCRSQWPRGLRHELSSLARMPGSWVRIPLKGIDICVYVYSVFVFSCV
jgi:hypothetical protein